MERYDSNAQSYREDRGNRDLNDALGDGDAIGVHVCPDRTLLPLVVPNTPKSDQILVSSSPHRWRVHETEQIARRCMLWHAIP